MAAVVPAWMTAGLTNQAEDNYTLAFTVYALCPGNKQAQRDLWKERFVLFNDQQKSAVRMFLSFVLSPGGPGADITEINLERALATRSE
jgi:hypothetical protein